MYQYLETERLIIRPITIHDKEFIFDLVNTKGWLKFIGNRKVKNIIDAEEYIKKILARDRYFYSVFELKDTKKPIGVLTFIFRDHLQFPDIGFAMLPQYEKNGYAFEAAKKYMDAIINLKETNKIIAITKPRNIHSIKLIEKLGLTYQGKIIENAGVLHLYALEFGNES